MKRMILVFVVLLLVLSGCAMSRQNIINRVDPISIRNQPQFQADVDECMRYAEIEADRCKKQAALNTGVGAAIGAGIGALAGVIVGHDTAGFGAGLGALFGAAEGMVSTQCYQDTIVSNCLINRGYRLLR